MSSSPQQSKTVDVDLTHEEQWVVHHALVRRGDATLEERDELPAWLVSLIDRIEGDEHTFSDDQARRLAEELTTYATDSATPECDVEAADRVATTLQAAVES